jgi:hypothetical protein
VTAGIYATERIENLTYTGVSSPTITEAASLYIVGAPTLTSVSTVDSVGKYALFSASGANRMVGSVTADTLATFGGPKQLVEADSAGTLSIVPSNGASATFAYWTYETTNAFIQLGEWAATSDTQFPASHLGSGTTTAIEYPIAFKALNVSGFLTITSNGGAGNNVTCSVSRNGSLVGSTGLAVVLGTTTGTISFGPVSTGSSSASDTYGLYCVQIGGVTGALLSFSYQMVLTP